MKNRWNDGEAKEFLSRYEAKWGALLALRTYTARLLSREPGLVLHGGGNTSVKGTFTTIRGRKAPSLHVKASGRDLAGIEPQDQPVLDLEALRRLRELDSLDDEALSNEFLRCRFDASAPAPSLETLVHAFLPARFIDHTHADAVLALTNQRGGEALVREALGDEAAVLAYAHPGFELAKASAEALKANPGCRALVWLHHGIVTWGEDARQSYETMIEMVSRAEEFLARRAKPSAAARSSPAMEEAEARWLEAAPRLRGVLAERSIRNGEPLLRRVILKPLISQSVLEMLGDDKGKELAASPPLTCDHLIRTKPLPLWIDEPALNDPDRFLEQARFAVEQYREEYRAYLERNASRMRPGLEAFDFSPRVIFVPGLGAACAGADEREARIVRDITAQTLEAKFKIAAMGGRYQPLKEPDLFDMEYYGPQHAKLAGFEKELVLRRQVAVVTGAAGAIGSGICRSLLRAGCHVGITDLPGAPLDSLVKSFQAEFGGRVLGCPLDVTDPVSVDRAFDSLVMAFGGVDLVVVNAGVAHVSSLAEMNLELFQRIERVNVEGTLLPLRKAARFLKVQGTGGDIVVISTKNVFCPGANFGAYSATKAASHQLARIASLELASIDVRVNMVSPDAVFSEGDRKSGLWAEVGPDRMRARGLDEQGLEEYYRNRNLLKARITAEHVGNAVLFFACRQTPTTGATIPVDGGLPDSTPR